MDHVNSFWPLYVCVPVLFVTDMSQLSYSVSAVLWSWRVVMVSCPRWRLIQSQPFADVTMWLKRWNTPKDASTLPVWVEQELPINNSLNIRLSSDVIPILVHRVNFLQWHFHSGAFVGVSESPLSPPSLPPSVCRQPLDVLLLCQEKKKHLWIKCVCLLVMMCDFAEQPSFAKSQGERCWHGARALMSGVWNSFAVSSDALCRPPLSTFCPLSGLGAAPFAPSLASLACYNEVGIPGMWDYIFPYTPLALLPSTPHQ